MSLFAKLPPGQSSHHDGVVAISIQNPIRVDLPSTVVLSMDIKDLGYVWVELSTDEFTKVLAGLSLAHEITIQKESAT